MKKNVIGLDLEKAYRQVDGNHELLCQVVQGMSTKFEEELHALKQLIESSANQNENLKQVRDLLHRYIGLTGNIAATAAYQILIKADDAAKLGDIAKALQTMEQANSDMKETAKSLK